MRHGKLEQGQGSSPPLCDWSCIGVKNIMADHLGGDFFDFLPTADGCQAVLLGDVTGHGISASVVMGLLYGYIHAVVESVCSPDEVGSPRSRRSTTVIRLGTTARP